MFCNCPTLIPFAAYDKDNTLPVKYNDSLHLTFDEAVSKLNAKSNATPSTVLNAHETAKRS